MTQPLPPICLILGLSIAPGCKRTPRLQSVFPALRAHLRRPSFPRAAGRGTAARMHSTLRSPAAIVGFLRHAPNKHRIHRSAASPPSTYLPSLRPRAALTCSGIRACGRAGPCAGALSKSCVVPAHQNNISVHLLQVLSLLDHVFSRAFPEQRPAVRGSRALASPAASESHAPSTCVVSFPALDAAAVITGGVVLLFLLSSSRLRQVGGGPSRARAGRQPQHIGRGARVSACVLFRE